MPFAARISDDHVCPMSDGPKPHRGGPVLAGVATVLIGSKPAARVGSACLCVGPPDQIVAGCTTVLVGGSPAARVGDRTAHGGTVTTGCTSVLIG